MLVEMVVLVLSLPLCLYADIMSSSVDSDTGEPTGVLGCGWAFRAVEGCGDLERLIL